MLKKRGQFTVFAIMIVIIIASFLFYLSLGTQDDKSEAVPEKKKVFLTDDDNIRNFAENCVEQTSKHALFYLGFVGGNIVPDSFDDYFSYDGSFKIPYFYVEGENEIPVPYDEEYWENLLEKYIDLNLKTCINDFEVFKGIKITHGETKSDIRLTDEEVIFNVEFPVTVTRNSMENSIAPQYIKRISLRLRDILGIVSTIVEQEVENDLYIHWDYLTDMTSNNYNITAFTERDNTIIYKIVDLEDKIDDEFYVFQFANKIKKS
jgi:hypothetical protein|tara:strand:+ start:198 stop:986 length:789 start_codon:yes stop_codon:yes gene_type:complete